WKPAALDASIIDRWPARLIDTPVYLRRLKVGIDLLLQPHELPRTLQVVDTLAQAAVSHDFALLHLHYWQSSRPRTRSRVTFRQSRLASKGRVCESKHTIEIGEPCPNPFEDLFHASPVACHRLCRVHRPWLAGAGSTCCRGG